MKKISPLCSNTRVGLDPHEWTPNNFDDFLVELEHIIASCSGKDPLPLFRGHADSKWLLESTFTRHCKKKLFDQLLNIKVNKHIRQSIEYHKVLLNLLLLKFGVLVRPTRELEILEEKQDVDAWFELMKRYQQYPEEDHPFFKGTFFLDWSKSKDVALYFANSKRTADGAFWICDAVATGETLQQKKVGEILDLMDERGNSGKALGAPLVFYPDKQIFQQRAKNQEVVYIAQMDLRYDLADIWKHQESTNDDECIFIKLILPNRAQYDCAMYLSNKGVMESFIFPE